MKVVILAAGIGSRLGNPQPKPLTKLCNGKSIMQMQVETFSQYFHVDNLFVVVGFKKELIMEVFPDLCYLYNPNFDTTNTSKSLLRALRKIHDHGVLWINGDVVFDKSLVAELLPHIEAQQSFVVVNTAKVGEEEVKYTLKQGYIDQLSKTVSNPEGEAVGINFVAKKDVKNLVSCLEDCELQDYFEKAIERGIQQDKFNFVPIDISGFNCLEVDFEEDLQKANQLLSGI